MKTSIKGFTLAFVVLAMFTSFETNKCVHAQGFPLGIRGYGESAAYQNTWDVTAAHKSNAEAVAKIDAEAQLQDFKNLADFHVTMWGWFGGGGPMPAYDITITTDRPRNGWHKRNWTGGVHSWSWKAKHEIKGTVTIHNPALELMLSELIPR